MTSRENEKATRYITQLDAARCDTQWNNVPELARKVEKHAPHRQCLALTARSEAQIALYKAPQSEYNAPQSPTGGRSEASQPHLSKLISPLLTAIDSETTQTEDAFQAKICLGWLHWVLGEPALAATRLPNDVAVEVIDISRSGVQLSQWTQACAVKGAYLKGHAQEMSASLFDAAGTYSSMLPYLESNPSLASSSPQFRFWTEQLLARLCSASMKLTPLGSWISFNTMLRTFHLWLSLWKDSGNRIPGQIVETGSVTGSSRWEVWDAYYETLSELLRRGFVYGSLATQTDPQVMESSEELTEQEFLKSRLQQRAEIKRIEANNDAILLEETRFPMATERNLKIERWVDRVMQNWRIMCGPTWHDEELGEGGKAAVARGVLDVLYRAATKTFHSTQILRYLFTVHASVAEFDLAFKAFDSYVEIVTRGKDRAGKTGEVQDNLDDDDTIIRTAAEAIRILTRFGGRKEAEKAQETATRIELWLKQHTPSTHLPRLTEDHEEATESILSTQAMALAYRAIGISQAHWARLTSDAASRSTLQVQAAQSFRKALEPGFEEVDNVETQYHLALVLAETREVPAAVRVVKQALASSSKRLSSFSAITADGVQSERDPQAQQAYYLRERRMIPFWHLLALLLTARTDFSTAARSCEAAFEQFQHPTILFGAVEKSSAHRSEHLNGLAEPEKPDSLSSKGLVDRMEPFEKAGIINVKMTQLALLEVMESPSAAVDSSDELLALYARLFGDPNASGGKVNTTPPPKPPKSAVGTIKGSILGRRSTRKGSDRSSTAIDLTPSRPPTASTTATPTIQVTDEDRPPPPHASRQHPHHHRISLRHKHHPERPASRRSPSQKLQRKSQEHVRAKPDDHMSSQSRPVDASTDTHSSPTQPSSPDFGSVSTAGNKENDDPTSMASAEVFRNASKRSLNQHNAEMPDSPYQPLRPIAHNGMHDAWPGPAGHAHQQPQQDIRLPAPFPGTGGSNPEPRFPALQERRHNISLLVSVWLFIAGLYTRAAMFEDATGAIDEAAKLVEAFENEVAQHESTAKAFRERGWGGGKSVEGLWGDVWAERGQLAQARTFPYEAQGCFEKSLSHYPDHPTAIVGLSEILLDIYTQKVPPEPPESTSLAFDVAKTNANTITTSPTLAGQGGTKPKSSATPSTSNAAEPEELNRLAARNRAYSLLSSLTKLGTGWDYSEAWYALARAYEEGGQKDKAREVLWWVVELEDSRPLRGWGSLGVGL